MSYYGENFRVGGLTAGLAMRGIENGTYRVVFEREYASLEQIETVDWSKPDIQGECILPEGYGFTVEAITYEHSRRTYTVHLRVAAQNLGDVTGYQEEIRELKAELVQANADLNRAASQLAEADEQIMALYEEMEVKEDEN